MPVRRDTLIAAQYLAAVAGFAAMRGCLTHPSSVRARLDDVRQIVEHLDEFPYDLEIPVIEYGVQEGYTAWAPRYDGPNPAVEASRAVVAALLDGAPAGTALDVACGTGGQAEELAALGYEVIGVDANEPMLDVARAKLPTATFHCGPMHALPIADASVDLVTCSLALTHVGDLAPAIGEMARVLRPGGWAVLADIHPMAVTVGAPAGFPTTDEGLSLSFVANLLHPVATYIEAALGAGLGIADCREPAMPEGAITANPAYAVLPDAVRQALAGLPFLLAWRLVKPG